MYLYVQIPIKPLFSHQSPISIFLRHKFVNLPIQSIFNFLLSWIPVMRHHTSLYENLNPSNRTIFWLSWSYPRFKVKFSKHIPTLLALSASIHGVHTEVSPEAIWGDARTKFPHTYMSVIPFYTLNLPLHRLISP